MDVLVLYFLFVSVGSPNMSTSTYTPTFLSVKNWPEITWWAIGARLAERGAKGKLKPKARRTYFNFDGVGDDPVHDVFGERVEVFVRPPHELGFQQVAAAPVVLEHAHVQLHREVWRRRTGGGLTPKQDLGTLALAKENHQGLTEGLEV